MVSGDQGQRTEGMKGSKEKDERKKKKEERGQGFLHSWFMYSKTLFRS